MPKGAKKRLARITQGLRDVFAVSSSWFGAGLSDPEPPQEQDQPDTVDPPDLVDSAEEDETCGTFAAQSRGGGTSSPICRRKKFKVLEIFSWAMVLSSLALTRQGWSSAPVCSIETGYDLTTRAGQDSAWALVQREDPDVITLAWPCTDWSLMQNMSLNRPDAWRRLLLRRRRSVRMIDFSARVAQWQNARHTAARPCSFFPRTRGLLGHG